MTKNKDLKKVYNKGNLKFQPGWNESFLIAAMHDWRGKDVLEIGCGEGHLSSMLAYAGATVTGVDFASNSINKAKEMYQKENLTFLSKDYRKISTKRLYDCIVMQGVLEHFDFPGKELKWIGNNLLKKDRPVSIVLSVPHWYNPRGFCYHTLRTLFDAKMTLTDLHFFMPSDIMAMAKDAGFTITDFKITDTSLGCGQQAINDLRDRTPKALPDLPKANLDKFLDWLKKALLDPAGSDNPTLGANAVYKMER